MPVFWLPTGIGPHPDDEPRGTKNSRPFHGMARGFVPARPVSVEELRADARRIEEEKRLVHAAGRPDKTVRSKAPV